MIASRGIVASVMAHGGTPSRGAEALTRQSRWQLRLVAREHDGYAGPQLQGTIQRCPLFSRLSK
jgi:hypothetical protein